jgi:hypothetical protein
MQDVSFEELVERTHADDRVAGLFLGGSRGKGANVRPDSDYDVRLVLFEEDEDAFRDYDTPRGVPVEVAVTTIEELRGVNQWDRYTLTHTKAVFDKTGEVQRLIDEQGRLTAAESERIPPLALDGYMNSLHRSLKRPGLAARIHASESVGHLLTCLFALEGRIRPFHDYLAWELETHPLEGWPAEELLDAIERVLGGERAPQQELFRRVEPHVRARGLGDVVDGWEPDLAFMRGTCAVRRAR